MKKTPINQLSMFGQSFWYDNITRAMLKDGDLKNMVLHDDLRGVTSNPTIFEKAITGSKDYDDALARLAHEQPNKTARDYFFSLAVEDIQQAADVLRPVYEKTKGVDGFVSLEVSPDLAHDTQASIDEAKRLFIRLNRPNVMIKVPATKAGIPVIQRLIADGVNVNATLLFSVERYVEVAKAYIDGIRERHSKGLPVHNIASVASFFVSRVDSSLDKLLEQRLSTASGDDKASIEKLMGQGAILNAKVAYARYKELFGSAFKDLIKAGAKPQRLLWASTGTKNAKYSDTLYIDTLIGPDTVNTMPPATVAAFKSHGKVANTLEVGMQQATAEFQKLSALGVNVEKAMQDLEKEGVESFKKSFENLLMSIDDKIGQLRQRQASGAA